MIAYIGDRTSPSDAFNLRAAYSPTIGVNRRSRILKILHQFRGQSASPMYVKPIYQQLCSERRELVSKFRTITRSRQTARNNR